jgi:hypothetical protein
MIRKLKSGQYRLLSLKKDEKTGHRQNLATFDSLHAARRHEREIHYFKARESARSSSPAPARGSESVPRQI